MDKYTVVRTRVANLYRKASFKSELITQALNKEKLLILKKVDNWYKVKQWDGYESWIHNFYIDEERCVDNFLFNDFKVYDFSVNKFIKYAKSFLNVPYLWGGKSSLGFDCSGLVQTVLKVCGYDIPRDSYQQRDFLMDYKIELKKTDPGDLHFFGRKGKTTHVAFSTGGLGILHSQGKVKKESLGPGDDFNKNLLDLYISSHSIRRKFDK